MLAPQQFLRRLAVLVPPPRNHLIRYFGVFAPGSASLMLLEVVPNDPTPSVPVPEASPGQLEPVRARRLSWAALLFRVLAIDVLKCPLCGGNRQIIACVTDPPIVEKILDHLHLRTKAPPVAPARAAPQQEFPFE